jgi:hypothetical protein
MIFFGGDVAKGLEKKKENFIWLAGYEPFVVSLETARFFPF